MELLPYSIVIPTFERGEALAETLESIRGQTHRPTAVVLVDGSPHQSARPIAEQFLPELPIIYQAARIASAAQQRNQGAEDVTTPLVAFFDDDMVLAPDACEKIVRVFTDDAAEAIGGIAARMPDHCHTPPKRILWLYYRLQAGFAHPTYGGKLFGPVINCLPSYDDADTELVASDWLNAGCVFYRTGLFQRERFPHFHGYSFMEDVHLSARIAKTHRLYFHAGAICDHRWGTNSLKRDLGEIARMRIRNQRIVAREVMGLSGLKFEAKMFLHRLFATVSILRRRQGEWWRELTGTWFA